MLLLSKNFFEFSVLALVIALQAIQANHVKVATRAIRLVIKSNSIFFGCDCLCLRVRPQIKAVILRASIVSKSVEPPVVESDIVVTACTITCIRNVLGVVSSIDWRCFLHYYNRVE